MSNARETVRIEFRGTELLLVVSGYVVKSTTSRIDMISHARDYEVRTGRIVENLNEVCK